MHQLKVFMREKFLEIIIIAIVIQLLTNTLSNIFGDRPLAIVLIALILFISVFGIMAISERLRSKRRVIGEDIALKMNRRGIIFTIGLNSHNSNGPVTKVINTLKPELLGFIGTNSTEKARVVESLIQSFGLKPEQYRSKTVDPTNIKEIKDDTAHLIDWMQSQGLSSEEIVIDLTGGTAVMSVAAFMATDERKIDAQYIFSEYRENKPIEGSQKALLVSHFSRS